MSFSGKLTRSCPTGRKDTERIDLDQVRDLARQHRPKLVIAGGSAFRVPSTSAVSRDCRRGGRGAHGNRHRASGGTRGGGIAPVAGALRGLRDHDHAQDAAGAGRYGDVPDGVWRPGPDGPARHPGRPADARDRRQGVAFPRGPPRVRATSARSWPMRTRWRSPHGPRHRLVSAAPIHLMSRRPDGSGHHRQKTRGGARPRMDHRQQERHPVRHEGADGDERDRIGTPAVTTPGA